MNAELLGSLEQGARAVTVNARLARELRREYGGRQAARAWVEPEIVPWSAWMERQWREHLYAGQAQPLLSARQETALWQKVIARYPGCDGVIDTVAAAELAREAWRLAHEWELPWQAGDWQAQEDSAVFWDWTQGFRKELATLGRMDSARLDSFVAERLAPGGGELWLVGFEELTARQRRVVRELESHDWAVTRLVPGGELEGNALRVALPDAEAEVEAAAAWALKRYMAAPRARIAVVFTKLDRVRAVVDRTFRAALGPAYHLALGPAMEERPLVAAALSLLELAGPRISFAALSKALASPYVTGAEVEGSDRALWEVSLRGVGANYWTLPELLRDLRCPPLFRERLRRVLGLRVNASERLSPAGWTARFKEILKAMGWPGDAALSSEEYQTRQRFQALLGEMAGLDVVWPEMTAAAAFRTLRQAAAETAFESENRGQPVQVMGALEAAGSQFDHLWVAGMDELSWPPAGGLNPFIPLSLGKAHGMPNTSPARTLEFARRVTQRLMSSAPAVVFSHAAAEGDRELKPSPLIAMVPEREAPSRFAAWTAAAAEMDEIEDATVAGIAAGGYAPGGVNAVRLQARCPFQAFAELRLDAKRLDRPDLGLDAKTRGTLIHRVLETCWREIGTSARLKEMKGWERARLVARAVEQAVRSEELDPKLEALERQRLEALTRDWLDLEAERQVGFRVEQAEQKRSIELGRLRLDTRVDRVDRLQDGRLVLIDYKTSTPKTRVWEGERPDDPQLPVYASTTAEPLAGVYFGQVRAGDVKFVGWSSDRDVVPDGKPTREFAERVSGWGPVVERLAGEFAAGKAEVDPKEKSKTCQWCHLETLCRVNEKAMREEE